jgi:hypothetical protein
MRNDHMLRDKIYAFMVSYCLLLGLSGIIVPYLFHSIVDLACLYLLEGTCLLHDSDKVR